MTDYNLIFGGVLLFNIIVTFRASSYWSKFFPKAAAEPEPEERQQNDEPQPLLGDKEGDVELANASVDKKPDKAEEERGSAASDAAASIRHAHLLRKYLVVYLLAAFSGEFVIMDCIIADYYNIYLTTF
jgi:hypothetical protein